MKSSGLPGINAENGCKRAPSKPRRVIDKVWKKVQYRLSSACPMIMHNGQTSDPLNKFSKALKKVSSKRIKTDSDHEEMAHIEFVASLYLNGNGPVIPAKNIEGMLIRAAMKTKEGQVAKPAMFCDEHAELEYEGPRDAEALYKDERFPYTELVVIQRARLPRTRVLFREWQSTVTINYEDSLVNESRIDEWVKTAGEQIGLMDWRPKFGRFTAKKL